MVKLNPEILLKLAERERAMFNAFSDTRIWLFHNGRVQREWLPLQPSITKNFSSESWVIPVYQEKHLKENEILLIGTQEHNLYKAQCSIVLSIS